MAQVPLSDQSGGSRQEDLLCRPRAMAQRNSADRSPAGGSSIEDVIDAGLLTG